jgi:hypothetical protein
MPRASAYVVLEVVGGMNEGCGNAQWDFVRNHRDGHSESGPGGLGWRVPPRLALVVTDVDWQYAHPDGADAAGMIQILRLFVENLMDGETQREFESTLILGSRGEAGISEAMTTGFVVSSKARICPDITPGPEGPPSGLQHLILRGYLIPDT